MQTIGKRVLYFDNAKFILIFLVVFGHSISPYISDSHLLNTIYKSVYTFHMPAFILISGYFAKGFKKKGYLKKLAKKLLIPYLIFQMIFAIFFSLQGEENTFTLLEPHWTLWFLLSLFSWHLLLLVFSKLRYSLLLSLIVGVFIGMVPFIGSFLSLSRTFVFFPFFLLGCLLEKKHFEKLTQLHCKLIGAILFLGLFISYYFFFHDISNLWLFASASYADIGTMEEIGVLVRFFLYLVMFVLIFSFLAFIPKRNYSFTKLGSRTLYVYLLHGITIKIIQLTPLSDWILETNLYILFVLQAIALTLLLSSKPILKATKPLIEPIK
ncbi:acyltransferase family protein [Salirhabdus sp. Marseille-P4669]|uniref:acyltransferase family protein n=1 Tax=Salirhabdus sp. Marseille-P4669 TaxID=2042310 RepID=UPI000C7D5660|nr:acyltransferase family protein [Salirhabdus sp. Marseille-P4669]